MQLHQYHRFMDEAGDMNFYGKKRVPILHSGQVSRHFIMGMLCLHEPLSKVRQSVQDLQNHIASHPYLSPVASVRKRSQKMGYFLHAKDDVPEIRMLAFELIRSLKCSFKAIVAEKKYEVFALKHNNREAEFYADMLSHLIGREMANKERLVLNIAKRAGCTTQQNLHSGLEKAKAMHTEDATHKLICSTTINVVQPVQEPLVNITDYFLWALQRKLEREEDRYCVYLGEQIEQPMIL